MFKTIVIGFDGSETARHALDLACDIAAKYNADLHLVHTPQPQTVAFAMGAVAGYHTATTMPDKAEVDAANAKVVSDARTIAKAKGIDLADTQIQMGEPADAIVDYANRCYADLIVTGRRGLGALGAIVQGSTSLRVNHLAKCAVLTVT